MISINFENYSKEWIMCYTDGSCNWRNKCGGYGILIDDGDEQLTEYFSEYPTTISRMELKGMIACLKVLNIDDKAVIYCDSEYTTNMVNQNWLIEWNKFNFVGKKNEDLLREYLKEYFKFPKGNIIIKHIRGHKGYEGNEICDGLAKQGYKEILERQTNLLNLSK